MQRAACRFKRYLDGSVSGETEHIRELRQLNKVMVESRFVSRSLSTRWPICHSVSRQVRGVRMSEVGSLAQELLAIGSTVGPQEATTSKR